MVVFQGCWIEQHNFQGLPGSCDYPLFLRRLNALCQCLGASLFPKPEFDEQVHFTQITAAIAQFEPVAFYLNDLFSFYKEFDEPRDQTSLARNFCKVDGISINQSLDRLAHECIQSCTQILTVFKNEEKFLTTIQRFIHGYVTWHLCDGRYRLREVYDQCRGNTPTETKFRHYFEQAWAVGDIDPKEWAVGPVELGAQQDKRNLLGVCLLDSKAIAA